jgi:hypothetical protein
MTDNTAALAAIMARLNSFIGRAATFRTTAGPKVTGTLSEYRLGEEGGGNVQVRFRECTDWYEVTGFPEPPKALPAAEPVAIERGDT